MRLYKQWPLKEKRWKEKEIKFVTIIVFALEPNSFYILFY